MSDLNHALQSKVTLKGNVCNIAKCKTKIVLAVKEVDRTLIIACHRYSTGDLAGHIDSVYLPASDDILN